MSELLQRITISPLQNGGRPSIRGMRIRVIDILDLLAADGTSETILADFPDLEADDIRAALTYASCRLDHHMIIDITRLPPAQRVELAEQLWDSLPADSPPISEAQATELRRRRAAMDADGDPGQPSQQVLDEIEQRGE